MKCKNKLRNSNKTKKLFKQIDILKQEFSVKSNKSNIICKNKLKRKTKSKKNKIIFFKI